MMPMDEECPFLRHESDGTTSCAQYAERPHFCRDFPAEPFDNWMMSRCGFTFERSAPVRFAELDKEG